MGCYNFVDMRPCVMATLSKWALAVDIVSLPYPQGDVPSPCEHSLHAAGRAWGALRKGIPIAPWGQHAVMGRSKANDSRAMS